jgi:hypothetical protein
MVYTTWYIPRYIPWYTALKRGIQRYIHHDIYHMVYTMPYTMLYNMVYTMLQAEWCIPIIPWYIPWYIAWYILYCIYQGKYCLVYTIRCMVYTINCSIHIMMYINWIYHGISNGIYIVIYQGMYHIISVHSSPTASMSPVPAMPRCSCHHFNVWTARFRDSVKRSVRLCATSTAVTLRGYPRP